MFSGSATDFENRCESSALNYTCDCFVPPDQFEIAEVHSEIFISIVTCWFKSSMVGQSCVLFIFCYWFFSATVVTIEMLKLILKLQLQLLGIYATWSWG